MSDAAGLISRTVCEGLNTCSVLVVGQPLYLDSKVHQAMSSFSSQDLNRARYNLKRGNYPAVQETSFFLWERTTLILV